MKQDFISEILFILSGVATFLLLAQVFNDRGYLFKSESVIQSDLLAATSVDYQKADDFIRVALKSPQLCDQFLQRIDKDLPQDDIHFLFPLSFQGLQGQKSRIRVAYHPQRNLRPPRAKIRLYYFKDKFWGTFDRNNEEQILVRRSYNLFFDSQDRCYVNPET